MKIILNEASNLTPKEKMRLWADGKRHENVGACGDDKLRMYGDLCISLAHQEPNLSGGYLLNAKVIYGELIKRGLHTDARALWNKINAALNPGIGSASTQTSTNADDDRIMTDFVQNAYEGLVAIRTDYLEDLEAIDAKGDVLKNKVPNIRLAAYVKLLKDFQIVSLQAVVKEAVAQGYLKINNAHTATFNGKSLFAENLGKYVFYYLYYQVLLLTYGYMFQAALAAKTTRQPLKAESNNIQGISFDREFYFYYFDTNLNVSNIICKIVCPTFNYILTQDLFKLEAQDIAVRVARGTSQYYDTVNFKGLGAYFKNFIADLTKN